MKWKVVATARRGSLQVAEDLSAIEVEKAQAQLDREWGTYAEHGVRIPAWSDEAKVFWNPSYRQAELERSKEKAPHVQRLVALAAKRGVA